MSRTVGFSPVRKSKRLFENGYYQIEQKDDSETGACIGCSFDHKTSSPRHGKPFLQEDCQSMPSVSQSKSQSPSYALRSRKMRNAKQKRQTPTSTGTLLPQSVNPPADRASTPAIVQRHYQKNGKAVSGHSCETLAGGEHVRITKKSKHLQPQIKHSTVLAETEHALPSPEVDDQPNLIIGQNYIESDDRSWAFSDDQSQEEEFSDASIDASKYPTTKTSFTPNLGSGVLEQGLQKLELSFEEMQLHIADRHTTLTEKIEKMQRKFDDNNEKITENQKNIMSAVESMVGRAIAVELLKNNEVFQNKIEEIQADMSFAQANHSNMVAYLQKEIYGKVGMAQSIHDSLLDKLGEFEKLLIGIEKKIAGLAQDQNDFKSSVAQRSGNVSYLREISNQQFIENFIVLMQKGAHLNLEQEKISDRHHHKYLAYLLLEWFIRKGFIDEKTLKKIQDQTARNFTKLQKNFKETMDKNLMLMKQTPYKPGITLDSLSPQGPTRLTEEVVKMWIKEALDRYSSDRIGIPDYALESAGASIVTSRCSPSFQHKTALFSFFGVPIYYNTNGPRFIIRPGVMPGECWAFKGSRGFVVISLSATIRPDVVTMDHVPKSLAFHNSISSAPKDFKVFGLKSATDVNGRALGMFRFEESGEPIQQFVLDSVGDSYNHIELKVTSNWGHPDFTCLYRFRVHGQRIDL